MDKEPLADFLSSFNGSRYPEALLQAYEPLECLASNQAGETLLVRQRQTGEHFVVKCYTDRSLLSRATEDELLMGLHHPGLPAFVGQYQNDKQLCVVREYAEGASLDDLARDQPFTEKQAVAVCQQLCDVLIYLHGQTPPIIHRDIKPQNVIMDRQGRIKLIDFGISRVYDPSAQADTVCFGTQEFAPPEQYGFSQTDGRADIFSLGVLLCWLLTGQTKLEQGAAKIANRRLVKVIRRCTAFAPGDRYPEAGTARRALIHADGHLQRRAARICRMTVALLVAVTAGFVLGRFTDMRPAIFYDNSIAVFSEPLIEQAVRLQLGKGEDEVILRSELDEVRELYLCSDLAARSWDEFNRLRERIAGGGAMGETATNILADVAGLKNLQSLGLGYLELTDISAVSKLRYLTSLEIYECPVVDISPLESLPNLTHLVLSNCLEVRDLSPLADCPNLNELVLCSCRAEDFSALASLGDFEFLHVQGVDPSKVLPHLQGKTVRQLRLGFRPLASVDDLAVINGLQELEFDQMRLSSLAGIERLAGLTAVTILDMPHLDLSPLNDLPYLRTVTVSESMRAAATAIAAGARFEVSYR